MAIDPRTYGLRPGGYPGEETLAAMGRLQALERGDFSDVNNPYELERLRANLESQKAGAALEGLRAATRRTGAETAGLEQWALNLNPEYARTQRWSDIEQADTDLFTKGLRRAAEQRRISAETGKAPLDIATSPEARRATGVEQNAQIALMRAIASDPVLSQDRALQFWYQFQLGQLAAPMNVGAGTQRPQMVPGVYQEPTAGMTGASMPAGPAPPAGAAPGAGGQAGRRMSLPAAVIQQTADQLGISTQELLAYWKTQGVDVTPR